MKRFLMIASVLALFSFALALAAEKPPVSAPPPTRVPEMSTAGKVLEITETLLRIERTLKGKVETMEFLLERPLAGIALGDQIKASYRVQEGRNILIRVTPAQMTAVQKGKVSTKQAKPVLPAAATAK